MRDPQTARAALLKARPVPMLIAVFDPAFKGRADEGRRF
jgi:hypothetical protein